MSVPPSGVLPADQADGRCGEGGGGLTRCTVHLADPQLHGVHLHTRESHQEIPHHAHQEVSACFCCTFSFFCPSLSLSLNHLLFLPNSFISSIPLQFSLPPSFSTYLFPFPCLSLSPFHITGLLKGFQIQRWLNMPSSVKHL